LLPYQVGQKPREAAEGTKKPDCACAMHSPYKTQAQGGTN